MLEQALDIARSSNEAKSQFLANMSHDIRTPINAIVGMTKIARESGEASEKIAGCLNAITASSRHLLELINDVLDMSRIESGQMELQERRFDIDDVVGGVEAIIRPQAQAKSQELRIDCSKMKHKAFSGDELRISQILLNLASNAVKYTPSGGEVTVTLRAAAGQVLLTVADSGVGIPPEQQAHLFDGYLEKLRMPPPPQGLGLGLPLCQAIARGHGGRLLLQSGPEGTTVTVSLPDRRCTKTVLREPPFAYGGGFHPVLLGLADALPYTAFTRKNLD